MKPLGLYIHIPFCQRKCYYCDFNSFSGKEQLIEAYMSALTQELGLYAGSLRDYEVQSVFIGGGTPSLVSGDLIALFLETTKNKLTVAEEAEITIEVNPGTLTASKLKIYHECGVNRLSFGLQACQDHLLRALGRIHNYKDFLKNLTLAREIGFSNINVDLMFALPNQQSQEWRESLEAMVKLEIPHISAYSLIWEEGTPFADWQHSGRLAPLDEELELDMYHGAIQYLKEAGYEHYEISNFARPSHRCLHNQIYWRNQPYLGLGAGSHSYLNGKRFSNALEIEGYLKYIKEGRRPVIESIDISFKDEISETMFLGLRMMEGISIEAFQRRFGISPITLYGDTLKALKDQGLVEINSKRLYLTAKGIDLSNQVFQKLLLD